MEKTETIAKHRFARISPQKARLMADLVRGKSVESALRELTYSPKKSAAIVKKVLESAVANAENNDSADVDRLWVTRIQVDQGPVLKRMHARAKGRGNRIVKRTSHILIGVSEKGAQ